MSNSRNFSSMKFRDLFTLAHPVYGILNGRVHTTVDNANAISESAHPFRLIKRLLLINRDENRPETDKMSRCRGR